MTPRLSLRPLAPLVAALGATLVVGLTTAPAHAAAPSAAISSARAASDGTDAARGDARSRRILVFGHRGAAGYRPEHTIAGYKLAIAMGADYIEPDLVSTKDGVLVDRHENNIADTTDVADHPEFAGRRATKTVDGTSITGWFTEDFTLAELKTLRAKERLPEVRPENTRYDGRYRVPTFDQVVRLAKRESRRYGRRIGIAPETKHPTYFQGLGLGLERPLLRSLRAANLDRASSKVVIQSFETSNLKFLDRRTPVDLVQLTSATGAPYDLVAKGSDRTYADIVSPRGLRRVESYADWLAPEKNQVIPRNRRGFLKKPTSIVDDAHRAGLKVVVYTFRAENQFLPADFRRGVNPNDRGNIQGEYLAFLATGIDAVFADQPDTAVRAVRTFQRRHDGRAA